MDKPLYAVYGASGCGRGIMPLARSQLSGEGLPADRLVFVDDKPGGESVNGQRLLSFAQFMAEEASSRHAVIAIANGSVRQRLAAVCREHGVLPWSVRADNSIIMDAVELGEGSVISPFVTLTSNIRIGAHFHANLYSYVEHDCVIGDFVTFGPAVRCNGNVVIEDFAYLGAGALIRQGVPGKPLVIGRGAVVGMGAVVTRDVPPGATVAGNPAKPLSKDR